MPGCVLMIIHWWQKSSCPGLLSLPCSAGWVHVPFLPVLSSVWCRVPGSVLAMQGVIYSTLLLFHNHTDSLPLTPCPLPSASSTDRPVMPCPSLAAEEDAALSRCGVLLPNPTARAQGAVTLTHVQKASAQPAVAARGPGHHVSLAVLTALSLLWVMGWVAPLPTFPCFSWSSVQSVSSNSGHMRLSLCHNGDEHLEATAPPWALPESHSRSCLWVTEG